VLIEQLPSVVREAAQGLAKANITLLNGADGLSEVASGLVSQGLAIFETVRAGLNSARPDNEARAIGNASDGAARPSTQP
jgi:flotillin